MVEERRRWRRVGGWVGGGYFAREAIRRWWESAIDSGGRTKSVVAVLYSLEPRYRSNVSYVNASGTMLLTARSMEVI